MCTPNFNSIKVRLKLRKSFRDVIDLSFQFHKGTIKTIHNEVVYVKHPKFQFHKGTIKTVLLMMLTLLLMSFQFHKGTIKTV